MIPGLIYSTGDTNNPRQWTFDAEPWFEQATPQQVQTVINQLHFEWRAEFDKSPKHNETYHDFWFGGEPVEIVAGWCAENDPALADFLQWDQNENTETRGFGWSASLDGEQVMAWVRTQKTKEAAQGAVDTLLGGN